MTKGSRRAGDTPRARFREGKPDDRNRSFRQEMAAALDEALQMQPRDFTRARAHTMLGQIAKALVHGSVLGDMEALGLTMWLLDDGAAREPERNRHGQVQHGLREIRE